jgi:amino acid transporter
MLIATAIQSRARRSSTTALTRATLLIWLVVTAGLVAFAVLHNHTGAAPSARVIAALTTAGVLAVSIPLLTSFIALLASSGERPFWKLWPLAAFAGGIALVPTLYCALLVLFGVMGEGP